MIIETKANTNPYSYLSGNSCIVLGPSLPEPVTPVLPEFCICDFINCEYVEKVFADPLTNDFWKNDKNEFLFKRLVAADTVTMELYRNDLKVADLNTNNEGTFFNGFPSGSAEQQLYVGYLLDWKLIEALYGTGLYQVKAQLNIIGVVSEFESRKFNLYIYSTINAHETVRMETIQNGNIIGSQFDFTDLDWYGSFRIPAVFGNPTPIYETDRYVTSTGREKRQIQDKMSREWFMKTKKLSWEVVEVLVYNKMMANQILITDYNIQAEAVWRRMDLVLKEPEKRDTTGNPNKLYNFTFEDNTDIYKKRNF
jgi:hypothetical protein